MIARLVLLCILFAWQGCSGCCSAGEPRIPKSVRKVLALEQLQARMRAEDESGALPEGGFWSEYKSKRAAKRMSKALLATRAEKWQRYFAIAHPGDEALLARIVSVKSEEAKITAKKFKLSWFDERTLQREIKSRMRGEFFLEQSNRLEILGAVKQKCLEHLGFDGHKSYLTDHCDIVITNENILSLENAEELRALFSPEIISMIAAYAPDRVFNVQLSEIVPLEQDERTVGIGIRAVGGYHIFAPTDFRYQGQRLYHVPQPLSMTFIPQKELDVLVALRRGDFARRIEQYRATHPGIPEHAVAEGVLAEENARVEAIGKKYNLSADTIQRAQEDTLITVPSLQEIELMRNRSPGALYAKKAINKDVGYHFIEFQPEQKGDEE